MEPAEIAWRVTERARTAADRVRTRALGSRWRRRSLASRLLPLGAALDEAMQALRRGRDAQAHASLARHFHDRPPRFVIHATARERLRTRVLDRFPGAAQSASSLARRIEAGSYDLLGYEGLRFGAPDIDWHFDPVSRRRPPVRFWADVPYLSPSSGDHKVIWELNRHQEWLQLGRASWLTEDAAPLGVFVSQLESWLQANPPGLGINWASALELSLRSLSWLWALELFTAGKPADADGAGGGYPWLVDLLLGMDAQLHHVERHLSRYFSPNTHLLGEGLALYVCGRALPELAASERRERTGRRVLIEESVRQVLPDGGHAERSTHYHRYTLDFYLLALSVARVTGDWQTAGRLQPVVRRLAGFMRDLTDEDGRYAMIGDDDGGELAPIAGRTPGDARASLWWAAAVLDDPDYRAGALPEAVLWMTAVDPGAPARVELPERQAARPSAAYPAAGYFVSRRDRSHLVFDAGQHGYLNAGHAHADALAVTLTVRGRPLLVDGGTATYTMDPALRDHFRSAEAHNTLTIDGRSPSLPAGPFHWRSVADGQPGRIALGGSFDYFEGSVAYGHGPRHERRILSLDGVRWIIADRVAGSGHHAATLRWHLHPAWHVGPEGSGSGGVCLMHPEGDVVRLLPAGLTFDLQRAEPGERAGLFSPVYGRTIPSSVLRGHCARTAPFAVATVVEAGAGGGRASARFLPVFGADEQHDAFAVLVEGRDGMRVTLFATAGRDTRTVILDPRHGVAVTTDARMLHAVIDPAGRLERACAVDCGILQFEGLQSATVLALEPVRHFDLAIGPSATWRISPAADAGPIDVRIDAAEAPGDRVAPGSDTGRSSHVRHRRVR